MRRWLSRARPNLSRDSSRLVHTLLGKKPQVPATPAWEAVKKSAVQKRPQKSGDCTEWASQLRVPLQGPGTLDSVSSQTREQAVFGACSVGLPPGLRTTCGFNESAKSRRFPQPRRGPALHGDVGITRFIVSRRTQARFRRSSILSPPTPETQRWSQCPGVALCALAESGLQTAFGDRFQ